MLRFLSFFGLLFLLLVLLLVQSAVAQVITAGPDSAVVATLPSTPAPDTAGLSRPAKAALWGLIPGGGQVYNRDYWKVPLVYGAIGGMGYSVVFANTRFQQFARAYRYSTDGDSTTNDPDPRKRDADPNALLRIRDFYRRNRDLSIIGTALIYGLSIAEALVDAHLSTFTVSDDLSLRVDPTLVPQHGALPAPGIGLTLSLNHKR